MDNRDAAHRVAMAHCVVDSALVLTYDIMEIRDHKEMNRRLFAVQKLLEGVHSDLQELEGELIALRKAV